MLCCLHFITFGSAIQDRHGWAGAICTEYHGHEHLLCENGVDSTTARTACQTKRSDPVGRWVSCMCAVERAAVPTPVVKPK